MRRIELSAALPASAAEAWRVLVDIESWPSWGRLATAARGELAPGHVWTVTLRGRDGGAPRQMRPRFLGVTPPRKISFETCVLRGWAARLVHTFSVEEAGPDRSVLRQTFEITGPLVVPLWPVLRRGALQFDELGEDLARRLGGDGPAAETPI